jgi:hypothetical protein
VQRENSELWTANDVGGVSESSRNENTRVLRDGKILQWEIRSLKEGKIHNKNYIYTYIYIYIYIYNRP